jgi:ribosome-associated protein
MKQDFVLKSEYIELLALLKATGIAGSGGMAKLMVENGEVHVNQELESRKRRKLRTGDRVEVGTIIIHIC